MVTLKELQNLRGKNALVTGGSGWVGHAICEALLEQGATVYSVSRGKSESFIEPHRNLFQLNCNLAGEIPLEIVNLLDETPIDILVLNAHMWPAKGESLTFGEHTLMSFCQALQHDVAVPLALTQMVFNQMKNESYGNRSIIAISSMYAGSAVDHRIYNETPGMGNPIIYGAGKAALEQCMRYIAAVGGEYGIRANSISLGPVSRPGSFDNKEWFKTNLENKTMLKEIGTPDDIKGAIVMLASDAGKWITGSDLQLDGGWCSW